jgi:chorismate mutase
MTIEELRSQINQLDRQMASLLNNRASLAGQIGQIKRSLNLPVLDQVREQQVLQSMHQLNEGPLSNEQFDRIFAAIMQACREIQS